MKRENMVQNNEMRYAIIRALNQMAHYTDYDKLKVIDICKKGGVSRATFYRYFYNIDDAVFWLWDECNDMSLYKMGNPYGWKEAKMLQFEEMLKYKDLFIKAFSQSEFSFITDYGQERILTELCKNVTEIHHYEMSSDEYKELEYFTFGGCFMFTKWVSNGMKESPKFITEIFGRLIPPFIKELFGE